MRFEQSQKYQKMDFYQLEGAGHTLKNRPSMSIKASNHNEQLIYYA